MRVAGGSEPPVPELEDTLNAFERSMADTDALDKEASAHFAGRLALYRALVAAIERLSELQEFSGGSKMTTSQDSGTSIVRGEHSGLSDLSLQ